MKPIISYKQFIKHLTCNKHILTPLKQIIVIIFINFSHVKTIFPQRNSKQKNHHKTLKVQLLLPQINQGAQNLNG